MEDLDRAWVLETSKLDTTAVWRSWGGSCLGILGTPGQGGDKLAEPGLPTPLPPQAGRKAHRDWGTLRVHAYAYMPTGVCPGCSISLLEKIRAEALPIPPGPAEGQLYVNWPFMICSQP